VGVIYTANNQAGNTPGIQIGANAAADYVNSQLGGINGHPVKVLACNGMNAPENSTACATKFVNGGVVDVVGLDGLWGANGQPIVAKAGIINQTTPLAAGEFTGVTSFPFDGGPLAGGGAVASYVLSKGWKSVACVYLDLASISRRVTRASPARSRRPASRTSPFRSRPPPPTSPSTRRPPR
jgi:branched-chain amino acid transport system substrate-binding protein